MSILLEKMRAARRRVVEIDGHHYTISRPTPMEAMEWFGVTDEGGHDWLKKVNFALKAPEWRQAAWYAVAHFVVDWDLTEIDLVPGGTPAAVPFDTALLNEWLLDRPDVLNQLAMFVLQAWIDYNDQQADAEKKPETGSAPVPEQNLAETS